MTPLLILLPLLLNPSAVTAKTLCDNQLSSSPARWGANDGAWFSKFATSGLPGLHASPTAPAQGQFSKTCRHYDRAPKVCCSATTLTAIEDAYTAAQGVIETASKVVDANAAFAKSIVGAVADQVTALCSLLGSDICNRITTTVKQYTDRLVDNTKAIAENQAACGAAITTFAQGMACFACEVDFANYLDLEAQTVRLAKNTCNAVYNACTQTLVADVNALFATVSDFANALIQDITGCHMAACKNIVPTPNLPDMCGGSMKSPGNCEKFVCHNMLNGLSSSNWLDWRVMSERVEAQAQRARRRGLLLTATAAKADGAAVDINTDALAEAIGEAPGLLATAVLESVSMLPSSSSVDASAEYNTYDATGYDAFAVGCADTHTCNGLPAWAVALVIVTAVAGVVAGVMVVRRWRSRAAQQRGTSSAAGNYGTLA